MADLVVKVRLEADGSGIVGQAKQSSDAIDGIGKSATRASQGAATLETGTRGAERETQKLGNTARQLTRSLEEEARESKQAAAALDAYDAATGRAAAGAARTSRALTVVGTSAGQQRAAFQQLGFQIQDVTQGLASGISPMTIFAQQGGQVAFAMSGLGGRIGQVGSYLTGPWGAALLGAGTIALAFGAQLFNLGEEAEKASAKTKTLAESLDAAALSADAASTAERTLIEIVGESILSAEEAARAALDLAQGRLEQAQKTREAAKAELEYARAIFEVQKQRTRGTADDRTINLTGALDDIEKAERRLDDAQKAADKAASAVVRSSLSIDKQTEEAAEKAAEASERAAKALDREQKARDRAAKKFEADAKKVAVEARKAAEETERFDKSMRELARSLREAEAEEFARQVDRLTHAYDPLQAAAEDYRKELELIDKLLGRGQINQQQAGRFRRGANEKLLDDLDSELEAEFGKAGKEAGAAFNREALARAEAIGQIIGGTAGDALTTVIGLIGGASTGDFTAIGGRTGGFATILADVFGGKNSPFVTGLKDIFNPLKDGLKDIGGDIASALGIKGGAGGLGQIAGRAAGGAAIGAGVSGLIGGSSLGGSLGGALGGALGGELLGSLGSFAGPVGSIVGAIGGSLIGGLLKGNKTAGAVITGPGNARIGGADTAAYGTAGDLGSAVTSGLDNIAKALGGTLTSGGITAIGTRGGEFRVNTRGDSLKGENGARGFGDDSAAAVAFALADRISDGAITGISQKVAQALRSSSDIDSAVQEAVKVKAIEELLAGILNPFETAINEFEGQMAERLRIGRQYGFDLVALEEQNNKERLALQEQLLRTQVGSIQDFLDDLSFGDLFQGSSVDKRNQLLTEIDAARTAAEEGQAGAAGRLAGLLRNLVTTSKDAFGTAGGFASDINLARTTGEGIVSEAQRQLDEAVKQTQLQDEANDQLAEQNTRLENIEKLLSNINFNGVSFGLNGLNPYQIMSSR